MVAFRGIITGTLGLVTTLYPCYGAVRALESGHDSQLWLMFFLILSVTTFLEGLLWPVLKWIPLYAELKLAFVVWLILPQTQGAVWVWETLLAPGIANLKREVPAFKKLMESPQDIISQATGQTGTGTGTGTGMHSGSFKETRGGPSVSSYKGT